MPAQPIVRSIVRPTVTGIVRSFGSSFVSRFGADLSAAYFLKDLGSKRGFVDGVLNPVVRVRRSNGDLRAFTANDITTGVLLAWVGTGGSDNGLVAKWYDGSGNHHDATQDTVGNMPKIVNAGALVAGGILFDGVNDFLPTSFSPGVTTEQSLFTIFKANTVDGSFRTHLDARDANDDGIGFGIKSSLGFRFHVDSSDRNAPANTNKEMLTGIYGSSSSAIYQKGLKIADGSAPLATSGVTSNYHIGNTPSGVGPFSGLIEGVFIYSTDKSSQRVDIESALAEEYNITLA